MENNHETFSYTYSAGQQEEIRRISQKYLPPEEDKMEQLRRLDQSAARPGKIAALTIGIISTLIFGIGMSCTMLWDPYFIPGIIIGVIGLAGIGSVYPVSRSITKRQRKKLAPQVIKLCQELSAQDPPVQHP